MGSRLLVSSILIAGLTLAAGSVAAESLWDADGAGLIEAEPRLGAGDLVLVEIDSSSSLTFSATTTDNKVLTLQLSGGDTGDLFSFLPQGSTGGDLSTAGDQDFAFEAVVGARVERLDEVGNALLSGSRSVEVAGKTQSILVTGWLDPARVSEAGRALFSELTDSTLTISSFLAPGAPVLSVADLETVVPVSAVADGAVGAAGAAIPGTLLAPAGAPDVVALAAAAAAEAAGDSPPGTAAAPVAAAAPATPATQLTDARRRELLLLYLNRLVDLIFQ